MPRILLFQIGPALLHAAEMAGQIKPSTDHCKAASLIRTADTLRDVPAFPVSSVTSRQFFWRVSCYEHICQKSRWEETEKLSNTATMSLLRLKCLTWFVPSVLFSL
jgi:hypothetical protein